MDRCILKVKRPDFLWSVRCWDFRHEDRADSYQRFLTLSGLSRFFRIGTSRLGLVDAIRADVKIDALYDYDRRQSSRFII